jgi:dTDP-glucose 4,6-dehydratase
VADHCDAIRLVLARGRVGETYNIGGRNELKNLDVVNTICSVLDELRPQDSAPPRTRLITFVTDRPGHDRRYAMNISKIESELGWRPRETFATGIRKTVQWYLDNPAWIQSVTTGTYRQWMATQYSL